MTLTRRRFLTGAAAVAATAMGAGACSSPTTANPGRITLWHSSNGLSDKVLAEAVTRFADKKLTTSKVSGELNQRLLAALSGEAYLPDITMIGDGISTYFSATDRFADLNKLGAAQDEPRYLPWKWQAGRSPDGFQLGFPIDIGPAALYYRADQFAEAGLPSEPDAVADALSTWDDYFEFALRVKDKLPGRYLITDTKMVFTYSLAQESQKYLDRQNRYLADQSQARRAWDRAVKAFQLGLTAGYAGSAGGEGVDRLAAWNTGKELSFVNASWITGNLKQSAPDTSGKWRVCRPPGGPGNQGGSFLAITRYCPDPQGAYEIVKWVLSPENQAAMFLELGLFPSSPAVYTDPQVLAPEEFFGGQATIEVFGKIAEEVKPVYFSPWDISISDTYTDELTNVESAGKDPERAWEDARTAVERLLRRQGVLA
ncbi:ABC transporter substrate-binding protein [Lentzea sp. NPDC051213]|uniref:ABC transporter substrate-binding protein n=1 Tax=Lentzea sp. NPDC051213 TaxID=3364126 RepID=UPI0037B86584